MRAVQTRLKGPLILEPRVFEDARGFFMETWNAKRYRELGIPEVFVQDNVSLSHRGVIRGLHFQNPSPQGKLVTVLDGAVHDVVVDLRRGSATFGEWVGVELSSENRRQVWIPEGFAHGFQALTDRALFSYKCTDYYAARAERSIRWDDPTLGIHWPIEPPVVSDRDRVAPLLHEFPAEWLFA
jgi:dTDP-4-dehydrorhamnose 3,5-epimerase